MAETRQQILIVLAGAAAPFVGIGLGRFAYNPLFPQLINQGWIASADGGYVGAFNLMGYLCGVFGAHRMAAKGGLRFSMNFGMAAMSLSFLACAFDLGLIWLCVWRLVAGFAGGILMVLAGPAAQAGVAERFRGVASGAVIAGVASGIMLGAALTPALPHISLSWAWLFLSALTGLIWLLTSRIWPRTRLHPTSSGWRAVPGAAPAIIAYGLAGAGMIPHMVFLSDLLIRSYGQGTKVASAAWLLFGLGGFLGALAGGRSADRLGGRNSLLLWLVVQIAAVALLLVKSAPALLTGGALGGFAGIGMTAVVLGYARRLAPQDAGSIWMAATGGFAISQALSSFVMARLFAIQESHVLIVQAGLFFSCSGLAVMLLWRPYAVTR